MSYARDEASGLRSDSVCSCHPYLTSWMNLDETIHIAIKPVVALLTKPAIDLSHCVGGVNTVAEELESHGWEHVRT